MGNNLENLSAKELKVIAESMGLVKGEDFQANASAEDMLELIEKQNSDDNSNEIPQEEEYDKALMFIKECYDVEILKSLTYKNEDFVSLIKDKIALLVKNKTKSEEEFTNQAKFVEKTKNKSKTPIVVTPVKRNGKIYKKGEKIDYFDGMEKLINDGIIKLID